MVTNDTHTIGDVSRIAGIPKDLLRMWERRYGYPMPERNGNGDRVYSRQQLEKLVLIRQLVDQGKRPGKLVGLELPQLESLLRHPAPAFDGERMIELLKAGDAMALRVWFKEQLQAQGLRAFVHRVMVPANKVVGSAWSDGALAIHEEHLYTESMKGLVRESLTDHYMASGRPRVMLTTLPGEKHSLGLLMVEALLRLGGAAVVSFGTEMPFRDIRDAADGHAVDVVAFSFSGSFKSDDAAAMLSGLRQMIDRRIEFWAGGAGLRDGEGLPEGVRYLRDLHDLERALATWGPATPASP